jgi:hypothetical protein
MRYLKSCQKEEKKLQNKNKNKDSKQNKKRHALRLKNIVKSIPSM